MKNNVMVRLMSTFILGAIVLAHISGQTDLFSANWLWLAILPAFMGLQATFTGWCPAEMIGKLSKNSDCCPGSSCSGVKKEPVKTSCCESSTDKAVKEDSAELVKTEQTVETLTNCCGSESQDEGDVIRVLGTGCTNCASTVKLIELTADELNIKVNVVKVEDIAEIASYGVMSTPAIVMADEVVHSGSIPSKNQVVTWLEK